jgi:hypothetical protein
MKAETKLEAKTNTKGTCNNTDLNSDWNSCWATFDELYYQPNEADVMNCVYESSKIAFNKHNIKALLIYI